MNGVHSPSPANIILSGDLTAAQAEIPTGFPPVNNGWKTDTFKNCCSNAVFGSGTDPTDSDAPLSR